MFADYCHIVDDAWWYYYHHKNYSLWQERADQLMSAMRKRMAAQQQRVFQQAAAPVPELLTLVDNIWDDVADLARSPDFDLDLPGHYQDFVVDV
jgi:hypothetical protein